MKHFRVARHTSDIQRITDFYVNIVGLSKIGGFNHDGYEGVFIGLKGHTWHLEFTMSDEAPIHKADEDDLLVLYFDDEETYSACLRKFDAHQLEPVVSKNPYWDEHGRTYVDPDGYRFVVCRLGWTNDNFF